MSSGIASVAVLPDALVSNAEIYNYDMSIDGYCGSIILGPDIYNLALIDSSSAAAQTEPLGYFEFAQSSVNMTGALIIIPVPTTILLGFIGMG